MSNRNNQNPQSNNGGNNVNAAPAEKPKKEKLIKRLIHKKDKIMASKWGRRAVRLVEGAALAGAGFGLFKAGQRSVKPTTVIIKEGVNEDENPQESTETIDQETGEVING